MWSGNEVLQAAIGDGMSVQSIIGVSGGSGSQDDAVAAAGAAAVAI